MSHNPRVKLPMGMVTIFDEKQFKARFLLRKYYYLIIQPSVALRNSLFQIPFILLPVIAICELSHYKPQKMSCKVPIPLALDFFLCYDAKKIEEGIPS